MNHINIEEFAGGALSVQVNKAIEEVTENIQDRTRMHRRQEGPLLPLNSDHQRPGIMHRQKFR